MNEYNAITPQEAARLIDRVSAGDCRIARDIFTDSEAALHRFHDTSGSQMFSLAMVYRAGVIAGKRLERYRRKYGKKSVE